MILDCKVAVCLVNENARFTNALVGIGKNGPKSFFMVVNRATTCDKFKIELGNVRLSNSTFEFRQPSKMIHLKDFDHNQFKQFRALVGHILSNNFKETAKIPKLEKVSNLKPKLKSLSIDSSTITSNKNLDWSVLRQFSMNNEKAIPRQVFNANNILTHVTLTECSLLSIPPAIRNVKKTLQFLNLSKNSISFIPMWFCNSFKKLQHLDLSFNRLRVIPQEMVTLKMLQSLFLQSNKIRFIHDRFLSTFLRGTTQFTMINLSNNQLAYLKLQLMEIRPETQIDLSHNKFSSGQKLVSNMKFHLQDDLSLQNIVMREILKHPKLYISLFDNKKTVFPVYYSFQNQSFICEDCKELRIHSQQNDHFCRRYPFKNARPPPNLTYTPDIKHLTYMVAKCSDCFKKNGRCICDADLLTI